MDTTSPTLAEGQAITATWRNFFAFLRRPRLPEDDVGHRAVFEDVAPGETRPAPPTGIKLEAFRRTLHLFVLDILLMAPILLVAAGLEAAGVQFPDNALAELTFGPMIIAAIVLGAPLMEELAFRGWLTGRPAALVGFGAVLVLYLGNTLVIPFAPEASRLLVGGALLALFVLAAILAVAALRNRPAPRWYARAFPLFYALSVIAFAAIHITNYEQGDMALWMLLPLVIPQAVAGLVWGYARVHFGLWSSMLLHAMHNGLAVGLILGFT